MINKEDDLNELNTIDIVTQVYGQSGQMNNPPIN
jgi:hypothetical protein